VGSLQAQRAPTTPAALDETRPAAINNPKPFTWTADPDKIIAAVRRGHQTLDSLHSHVSGILPQFDGIFQNNILIFWNLARMVHLPSQQRCAVAVYAFLTKDRQAGRYYQWLPRQTLDRRTHPRLKSAATAT
jgi:hypothetical protein